MCLRRVVDEAVNYLHCSSLTYRNQYFDTAWLREINEKAAKIISPQKFV